MSNIPSDPLRKIKALSDALEHNTFKTSTDLISAFRQEKDLLAELPAVFEGALESILERLESTAMFTEESCSFSQSDMVAALTVWLDKARSYLEKQMGIQ
ncbi:hypothetical protein [Limnobacter sp.]|uniref:hypothetical protein n=1 Tax=Limnobacter sp. TaxID=2003368 RepID=UPI0035150EAD